MSGPKAVGNNGIQARRGLLRHQEIPYEEEKYCLTANDNDRRLRHVDLSYQKNYLEVIAVEQGPKMKGKKTGTNKVLTQLIQNSMGSSSIFREEEKKSLQSQIQPIGISSEWNAHIHSTPFLFGQI